MTEWQLHIQFRHFFQYISFEDEEDQFLYFKFVTICCITPGLIWHFYFASMSPYFYSGEAFILPMLPNLGCQEHDLHVYNPL
jgi:hypothetical protein